MANYVKFRRGTIAEFNQLEVAQKRPDTLYFIENEDQSIDIYLGDKLITDGVSSTTPENPGSGTIEFEGYLNNLTDVEVDPELLEHGDALVYNAYTETWENGSVRPKVFVAINENNLDHNSFREEYFKNKSLKDGDIVIIKTLFSKEGEEQKYKHSAYIYSVDTNKDGHWESLTGDILAENVYFNNNFVVTENIGTIEVDKTTGSTVLEATGKNLKEVLSEIFAQEKNPVTINPSAKITWNTDITEYEVGTLFTPSYTITLNPGSYSFDSDTGVELSRYNVKDSNNVVQANSVEVNPSDPVRVFTGEFDPITIEDGMNYNLIASVKCEGAIVPHTNLGNEYQEGQIEDPFSIDNFSTKAITGYRKCFYGALAEKIDPLTESDIKNLTNSEKISTKTYSLEILDGTKRVVFACPKQKDTDSLSVKDVNAMYAEIGNTFNKYTIKVSGANDFKAIDYNVFIKDYGTEVAHNTYEIKIQ